MSCRKFDYNEILHRSCNKCDFDYVLNRPNYNAFLIKKRDNNELSVQPTKNRKIDDVVEYFKSSLSKFENHCGYSSFSINDCSSLSIECCDDSIPPTYYHAHITPLEIDRLVLANFLYNISKYTSYNK